MNISSKMILSSVVGSSVQTERWRSVLFLKQPTQMIGLSEGPKDNWKEGITVSRGGRRCSYIVHYHGHSFVNRLIS